MTEGIVISLIALMGTIITSIGTLYVKNYLDTVKERNKNSFSTVVPLVHEIYSILNDVMSKTKAFRVVIMKTENGGGRPQIGCELKSSVVYEVFDSGHKPIKLDWQKQVIDEQYSSMLSELILSSERCIRVKTADMPDYSMLKIAYQATGVVQATMYELAERGKDYIYLSVIYGEETELTAEDIYSKRNAVNRLRSIFKQYDGV